MKIIKQNAKKILLIQFLLMLIISLSACSKDPVSPQPSNISGSWEGSITHPAYTGGSLTLNILQTDNSISGTFRMRLVKGNFVQQYSGTIDGAKTNENNFNIWLKGTNFTWMSELNLNSNTLKGNWSSTTVNGIKGTISVQSN